MAGKLDRLVQNPWFAISGWVVGLIGLVISVLFYMWGVQTRALMIAETGSRSIMVQRERPSGIAVTFRDRPITDKDVVAAQFTLWNAGTLPIKPEHVLTAIAGTPGSDIEVLDVSIPRKTRDIVEPIAGTPAKVGDPIGVGFRILEPNDGLVVQVVYAGPVSAGFSWSGVIEGQGSVGLTNSTGPVPPKSFKDWFDNAIGVFMLGLVGIGLVASAIKKLRALRAASPPKPSSRAAMQLAIGVGMCVGAGYLVFAMIKTFPVSSVPPL